MASLADIIAAASAGRGQTAPLAYKGPATVQTQPGTLSADLLARYRDGLTNASAFSAPTSEGANQAAPNYASPYYDPQTDSLIIPGQQQFGGGIAVIPHAGQYLNGYSQRGMLNGMPQLNYDRDGRFLGQTAASGFTSGDSSLGEFLTAGAMVLPAFGGAIAGGGAAGAAGAGGATAAAPAAGFSGGGLTLGGGATGLSAGTGAGLSLAAPAAGAGGLGITAGSAGAGAIGAGLGTGLAAGTGSLLGASLASGGAGAAPGAAGAAGEFVIPEGVAFTPATSAEMAGMGVSAGAAGSLIPGISNATLAKTALAVLPTALSAGGTTDPTAGMSAEEAARQQRLQASVDAINRQFGYGDDEGAKANKAARQTMYGDISGAVRDQAMRDLDRQYTKASRANTFGLARSGLLGGSADAESGGELSTLYGEGKMKAEQLGQQAGSDLRTQDEKTRQNIISLAQSGLDTGQASSIAAGQMSAAADQARSQAAGASVGRMFDDLSQAYVTNQVMRARYPNGVPQQQSSGYSTNVFNPGKKYVGVGG